MNNKLKYDPTLTEKIQVSYPALFFLLAMNLYLTACTLDGKISEYETISKNPTVESPTPGFSFREKMLTNGVPGYSDGKSILTDDLNRYLLGGTTDLFGSPSIMVQRLSSNGNIDLSFADAGTRVLYSDLGYLSNLEAMAQQSDGKIVVVGNTELESTGKDEKISVWRLSSNGNIDSSFGSDGRVQFSLSSTHDLHRVTNVKIQSNGKIVLTGYEGNHFDFDIFLVRLNGDGSFDSSFGTDGIVKFNPPGNAGFAADLEFLSDGKILIAGSKYNGGENFLVARFLSNGTLDTGFNGGLGYSLAAYGDNVSNRAHGIAVQSDGKILIIGGSYLTDRIRPVVMRFNANGTMDTGFGVSGFREVDFGADDSAPTKVLVKSDGKIIVTGYSSFWATNTVAFVLQLTSDGALDTASFGAGLGYLVIDEGPGHNYGFSSFTFDDTERVVAIGGYSSDSSVIRVEKLTEAGVIDSSFGSPGYRSATASGSTDVLKALLIQSDEKIVTIGSTFGLSGEENNFALMRAEASGALDTTFGTQGKTQHDISAGSKDEAHSAILTDGDKVLVAGYSNALSRHNLALTRYLTDGSPDLTYCGTGTCLIQTQSFREKHKIVPAQSGQIFAVSWYRVVDYDFKILRINSDGSVDNSFPGGSDPVYIDFGANEYGKDIKELSDGKVLVVGDRDNGGALDLAIARLNANGTLDTSFNGSGKIVIDISAGSQDYAKAIIPADNGNFFVLAETVVNGNRDVAVLKLKQDGTFDTSFDGDGIKVFSATSVSDDFAASFVLLPNGDLLVAGDSNAQGSRDILLFKLDPSGQLVSDFGTDGVSLIDVSQKKYTDSAQDLKVLPDGHIMVAGTQYVDRGYFVVVKCDKNGILQ
ncbi:MAG: hypothetical protein KUL82_02830 [Bdellovibrio sp.]|nr:hypothetical protein [Bdellovibrio sp.]